MCIPWELNPQPLCHCHESCPCTSCYSPPEVTRSPHGLLHHTNGCTSPKTTFPIAHCTDVTQLIALITQLIALITLYISRGLPLCHRRVLYSVYPSDSYSTEPTQSSLPCLALPCLALPCLALPCLDTCSCTWIISLPCPVGYCSQIADLRLPKDYSLSCHLYTCLPMCDPCLFPTMPPNKALQMDPHASRLVTATNTMLYH